MKAFIKSVLLIIAPVGAILGSLSKTYTFSTSDLTIDTVEIEGTDYHDVYLKDCINDANFLGDPSLPVMDVVFILDPCEKVDSVYITSLDSTTVLTNAHPMPQQYPKAGTEEFPFVDESFAYYVYPLPGIAASIGGHGVSAEAHIVTIRLYPVQFDPEAKNLKLYTSIGISLHTEEVSRQTLVVYRDSLAKEHKKERWESVVENPEDVSTYLQQTWKYYTLSSTSQQKMAIITVPELVPAFERLAEWKTQRGCSTGVYTIPELGNGTYSSYYCAEVLDTIRDFVSLGCEYILLGGGWGIIPIRSCYCEFHCGGHFTDLYYADCGHESSGGDASDDVNRAWDENLNEKYGEPYGGGISIGGISFPDALTGYVVGVWGNVRKTTNGGQDWNNCGSTDEGYAYSLYFTTTTHGVMGGSFGILRTTDGGENWDLVEIGVQAIIKDIDFIDEYKGWAVGWYDPGVTEWKALLLKTNDGGATWTKVDELEQQEYAYEGCLFSGIDAVSSDRLWIVGDNTILKVHISEQDEYTFTEEWRGIYDGSYGERILRGCAFFDADRGCTFCYVSNGFEVFIRAPNGSWYKKIVDFSINDMCATSSRVFIFGEDAYYSDNYGFFWTPINYSNWPSTPVATILRSDPDYIWVAGGAKEDSVTLTTSGTATPPDDWETYDQRNLNFGDRGVSEWAPDVAVGRLPVHTAEEAELLVDKIITYEKNPPEGEYTSYALFSAPDMERGGEHDYSCIENADAAADAWEAQPSRTALRLYYPDPAPPEDPQWDADKELTKTIFRDEFEKGYNFVYHHDHGTYLQFGTEYWNQSGNGGHFKPWEIADFDNGANWQEQSVIYTSACGVADYKHLGYEGCVSLEFLHNPRAGAVAFMGGVAPVHRTYGNGLGANLITYLFDENPPALKEALDNASIVLGTDHTAQGTCYNFHLMGDPSLQMWNGPLNHFADAVGWEENGNEVNVTVYNDEQPPETEDNATVCLYMKTSLSGNGYYEVQETVNGVATFSPAPPDGAILITVTKQNFVPHQEWKLKGNVSDTPIVVHYSHPTEHPNTHNIAIDINGNLHLVYTDKTSETGPKVAKYAFSANSGETWVIKEIDPNEEQETHSPALALRNGINPYVAYFVGTDYCKVANLANNNRIALDDREMDLIGGPGFVINNPNEGYVAMRSKSWLYYRRIDLDKLDQGWSDPVTDRMEKYFLHDKMQDPQVYFGGSGSAIGVVNNENLLSANKTAKPIIVADRREESGSIKLYYWFPEEEPDGHDPEEFCEGWQPSISTDGAYVAVAYSRALKPRVRRANFYGPLEGSIPEEETPPQAEGSPPQTFHPDALVWPYGNIYLSVYDPVAEEWTIPCGFGSSISYYPSADVNIPLDLGACAWSSKDENDDYWLHVYVNGLDDFPNEGGGRKFSELIVTSPEAGDIWRFGVPEFIQWWQSKDSDGWTIDITWNADPSWHRIDDGTGHRYVGPNSYLWEVGKLKYGQMPVGYQIDEDNYMLGFDSCYIKVTCENMTGISKRFCITPLWVVWPPKEIPTGPLIVGTPQQTEWGFVSAYSCSQMNLLISTNNGLTFSMLSSGNLPSDSSVYDTVIFGPNNDTLVRMLYTGTIDWEVPNTHCSYNAGCLKLVAEDTTGDTASCVFGQFTIPLPGCHVNSTAKNQRIMAEGITSGSVGIAYTTQASDTSSSIIRYTETSDGLSLSEPDSLGIGVLPSHSGGQVIWLSANHDTIYYSYWDDEIQIPGFSAPMNVGYPSGGGYTDFAPVGIVTISDTVHTAILRRHRYQVGGEFWTTYVLYLRSFLKDNPQSFEADTISIPPRPGWDTTELSALSLEVLNGERHLAFAYKDTCLYFTDGGSVIALSQVIAEGLLPTVAVYEGNVAYSYLSSDSTKLIRLWRYRDDMDITWVSADTFTLTDTLECLTAASGLLYGLQTRDSAKAQVCLYGPLSEAFYLQERLDGYHLHARHIPGDAEQWYLGFTQVDNSNYFLSTRVEDIRTLYPALYLKSALDRAPYTSYRDTCILIDDIYVDYGQDSLVYEFDRLSPAISYSVLLEFLSDADTTSDVAIEVNGQLDTLLLPAEGTMWYETDLSATSDLTVRLNRLGREPITLRRLVVRHSDPKGYAMGGPQGGPIPTEIPFCLYQPLPNPFGDAAMIRYSLPYATHVSLKIYDISGRLVTKLVDGEVQPGAHTLRWDAKDDSNRKCASGVYFVRFIAGDYQASKKMVLIK